jgi:NAD(P)-dependent dehydrogenase (short-subunit alcohol dehydrogenase family)
VFPDLAWDLVLSEPEITQPVFLTFDERGRAWVLEWPGYNWPARANLPGMTETERVEQLFRQRAEATGISVAEVRAALIAKDGLARLGKPEDIAALTLFLCSESARHVQGAAIAVDGGATPGVH